MNINDISTITNTLNQFNKALEISGLSQIQDTFTKLNESINCSLKPIIDLSDKWNKTQEELFGSLKPALDNISEFSNKVSNTLRDTQVIHTSDDVELLNAFTKYEEAAPLCLYTSPEIIVSAQIDYTDDAIATKEDVQELRFEVERLHKDMIFLKREKSMNPDEFSDEAEYIYSLIYKHHLNGTISNHAVMIEMNEFSEDLNDSAFELGLEELVSLRYISGYESYIDGSYRVELCLRCSKALKDGKSTLSVPVLATNIEQKTAIDMIMANPPYIQNLIDNGVILKDMNVVKSLNDVAGYIHDNFNEIKITKQLLKQFHHNEKEYSEKKLEEAVTYAYSIDR